MPRIGRYEIVGTLGKGGMGIVYLAQDTFLERQVAVKSLLAPEGQDRTEWENLARRFIREAKAAAALNHPNLVAIYDVVADGESTAIVMEYVKGQTLAKAAPLGSCPTREFVTRVLGQCASALDHAHSRGIVHRDIKPENIMLDEAGTAKVADFGIAKLLNASTDLTHGFAIGTLEYMSPEQLGGRPVDRATDQYSLAVVAYRMLTGCRVFDAETTAEWYAMILGQPPEPPSRRNKELSPAVDAVLARAMEKAPGARYATCAEFVEELDRALAAPKPVPSKPPSRPVWVAPLLIATLLAMVGAGYYAFSRPGAVPTKKVGKDGLTYVWIPPGRFMMGCSEGDNECQGDEKPPWEVAIPKGFWMGETEVTQEAYQRVTGQNPSHFKGPQLPVEQVNWTDANAYCEAVGMRLPSESEWEYAGRGGSPKARYGNPNSIAWYDANSNRTTHDVKTKQPNAYGLYDMLGNVWEWTGGWYEPNKFRPLRGGSWVYGTRDLRVSGRVGGEPVDHDGNFGFRCAGG